MAIASLGATAALVGCGRSGQASACVDERALAEGERSLRMSLNYRIEPSEVDIGRCRVCAFYTTTSGGQCGSCRILNGPVDPAATCTSWARA